MISERVTISACRSVAPAGARPRLPEFLRGSQRVVGIHRLGKGQVRGRIRENERHPLPGRHDEVADRGQPLAPKLDRRAQVPAYPGPRSRGDRRSRCALPTAPNRRTRTGRSIPCASPRCRACRPPDARDGTRLALRARGIKSIRTTALAAVGGGELGFEDQRVAPVATPDRAFAIRTGGWRDRQRPLFASPSSAAKHAPSRSGASRASRWSRLWRRAPPSRSHR